MIIGIFKNLSTTHTHTRCVGITHDPAARTPFDNVYWAIGARYEPTQVLF